MASMKLIENKTSNSVRNKIKNKKKIKSRSELWMEHSQSKQLMDSNPGYYKSLIENFKSYPNPCFSQIDLDIKRTFPHLKTPEAKEREKQMTNILYSYAKRNPTIGY